MANPHTLHCTLKHFSAPHTEPAQTTSSAAGMACKKKKERENEEILKQELGALLCVQKREGREEQEKLARSFFSANMNMNNLKYVHQIHTSSSKTKKKDRTVQSRLLVHRCSAVWSGSQRLGLLFMDLQSTQTRVVVVVVVVVVKHHFSS